jgi:hypothetical protein
MEQTHDCLNCGDRWDFKANCSNRSVDTVTTLCNEWSDKHLECTPTPKGDSLRAYNDWYFEDSTVIFDADLDQLYRLIKLRQNLLTYEEFLKQQRYMSFSRSTENIEVHRIWPKWRYYMFKQMWDDSKEDLISAIKGVGARVVSLEENAPMPKSRYNWDSPRVEPREPERIW